MVGDFDFRSQVHSAAVSVSNNIAGGFDSRSKKGFIRFLNIPGNACNEVTKITVGLIRLIEKQLNT
ncbi:MAG: four helix bundle protein [Chitinophagaceae bacterium]|nr:four helix bundle protein [Chitinophagaceae bacterium]